MNPNNMTFGEYIMNNQKGEHTSHAGKQNQVANQKVEFVTQT